MEISQADVEFLEDDIIELNNKITRLSNALDIILSVLVDNTNISDEIRDAATKAYSSY